MKSCIFCDEEVDERCMECPNCDKKPFSGMYLDEKIFPHAQKLENKGQIKESWGLLYDAWCSHSDHEYYDDKVMEKIGRLLDEMFKRNNQLLDEKIIMCVKLMIISAYWDGYDPSIAEEALELVRENNRIDLEIEILENHCSIQTQRYGGKEAIIRNQGIRDFIDNLRQKNHQK